MLPDAPLRELYSFVVEQAPAAHPVRRAKVYRGLALIVGDEQDAATLLVLADECEQLEQDCRQPRLRVGKA